MSPSEPHPFRSYFILVNNPNNKSNALAVCKSCISKCGDLEAAKLNPDCYTANRSRLYRAHLIKCENFVADYGEEAIERIKAISVPEDNKKRKSSKKSIIIFEYFSLFKFN